MSKTHLLAAATGAVIASAVAGGVAWATIPGSNGVIQGCYDSGGNVKVVPALPCPKGYTPLQWSQGGPKGDPGADGVSPAVTQLSPGDANCPAGGAALTDASGSTAYVCNGAAGADGQPFAGTFTSPNGEYSISVTDAGVTLRHGSSNSIMLAGDDLVVRGDDIEIRSDRSTTVLTGTALAMQAGGAATVESAASLTLGGNDVDVRSDRNTTMLAGGAVAVQAGTTATVESAASLSLITAAAGLFHASGPLNLQGSVVNVN